MPMPVVIGEAENTWPQLLQDFGVGQLQIPNRAEHYVDLWDGPQPSTRLVQASGLPGSHRQ